MANYFGVLPVSPGRQGGKNQYKFINVTCLLDIVNNGLKLELNQLPSQCSKFTYPLSFNENEDISAEIMKLLKKKVIVHSTPEYNEFISGIFPRNKKDGNKIMILNLKIFNKFVNYEHFRIHQ